MPSPVGHFLGGLAVGWLAARRPGWGFLALCGVAAALPDADFLLPIRHRGASHSLGAAAIAGAVAYAFTRATRGGQPPLAVAVPASGGCPPWRITAAIGLAYATHVLFDWLGADSSTPRGLMALWPVSTSYYISDLDVFNSVDRRYWLDGFWGRNIMAVTREILILGPLAWVASLTRSGPRWFRS